DPQHGGRGNADGNHTRIERCGAQWLPRCVTCERWSYEGSLAPATVCIELSRVAYMSNEGCSQPRCIGGWHDHAIIGKVACQDHVEDLGGFLLGERNPT